MTGETPSETRSRVEHGRDPILFHSNVTVRQYSMQFRKLLGRYLGPPKIKFTKCSEPFQLTRSRVS